MRWKFSTKEAVRRWRRNLLKSKAAKTLILALP
jgi:hypothetical protein